MVTNKGNLKSEQLLSNGHIVLDYDSPIRGVRNIESLLQKYLGSSLKYQKINNDKLHIYSNNNGNKTILLCAAITYMGGNGKITQHPSFLNRIQIPNNWKNIVEKYKDTYDIKFLGIYHYKGLYVFTEIVKDTYLKRKLNNSSAHIYMNDLYKAISEGYFKRVDQNDNILISISDTNLKKYLDNTLEVKKDDFSIFREFNQQFFNDNWIVAIDSIKAMKNKNFTHWKQGEWPGWNLEYEFSTFLKRKNISSVVYAGDNSYNSFEYDFDLWFSDLNHYGDLKSSDSDKKEVPGNDKKSVVEVINKYGKLWYVVYEHNTKKDKDYNYEQTKERTHFIKNSGEWGTKKFNELSYGGRMKHSVRYHKMFILEISSHNYTHYLNVFNQGRQPDGALRNEKIKFSKHQIENAIVYSESI